MAQRLRWLARIILVLLGLAGIDSLYWLLFSIWMTAYPFADIHVWRIRFYTWSSVTVLIGICWIVLLVCYLRQRRNGGSNEGGGSR